MGSRIAKIEAQRAGPAAFVVLLPADAYDHGTEHLERVTAEAIREHRARTGYQGAVLIGCQECMSVEEWTERYCVRGGGDPAA
ncbi:hypothetical protein EAH89_21380 [Roseomonas nepalensis]|uniref:Uncharacterized protein n=2 Tax=Muricoccus nepalensis TaxID=1854500 RepID=A0A502FJZ0_9PROT|nr:hypothetical protein EAH89_21380 [Roseomonas nepalensis]